MPSTQTMRLPPYLHPGRAVAVALVEAVAVVFVKIGPMVFVVAVAVAFMVTVAHVDDEGHGGGSKVGQG